MQQSGLPTRSQLLHLQATLNTAASGLSPIIDLLPDVEPNHDSGNVVGIHSRLSEEARQRIRDANKDLWVTCSKPQCNGVRHRKTHPHIRVGVKSKAA